MRYETLESRLDKAAPRFPRLERGEALRLIERLIESLESLHQHQRAYPCLAPGLILLTPKGRVLLDEDPPQPQGQSVLQRAALQNLTPYLAPEQLEGSPPTPAANIYSLGFLTYLLLAGQRPGGPILSPTHWRRRLPPELNDVLRRALHSDPAQRWNSVGDFWRELQIALRRPGFYTPPPPCQTLLLSATNFGIRPDHFTDLWKDIARFEGRKAAKPPDPPHLQRELEDAFLRRGLQPTFDEKEGITDLKLPGHLFQQKDEAFFEVLVPHLWSWATINLVYMEEGLEVTFELDKEADKEQVQRREVKIDGNRWINLGFHRKRQENAQVSLDCYERGLRDFPQEEYLLWHNSIVSLSDLHREEDALQRSETALRLSDEQNSTHRHMLWFALGGCHIHLAQYEEAHKAYQRSLDYKADYWPSVYDRACVYALEGRTTEALSWLRRCLEESNEFYHIKDAREDMDFLFLRQHPEFLALTQPWPTPDFAAAFRTKKRLKTTQGNASVRVVEAGTFQHNGKIVAADPLKLKSPKALAHQPSGGTWRLLLSVARFELEGREQVLAAMILPKRLRGKSVPKKVVSWQLAFCPGELTDPQQPPGYSSSSPIASFAPLPLAQTLSSQKHLAASLWQELENIELFGSFQHNRSNLLAFSLGQAQGPFPSYWGLDKDDEILCLVTDCGFLPLSPP